MATLSEYLKGNSYPGRGILIGKSGGYSIAAYFIMGRSTNSRNRVFVLDEGGMRTKAFDESKVSDPSLIIYWPVRELDGKLIVTNGDQTDTIYEYLKEGKSFTEALRTRKYEPDRPNYTPRISSIVMPDGSFEMSVLKNEGGEEGHCARYFFEYEAPLDGHAKIIHTYQNDGNPLPPFVGEPRDFEISGDIDTFTDMLWSSLNEDNKVSLYVRYTSLADKSSEVRIVNKNRKEVNDERT